MKLEAGSRGYQSNENSENSKSPAAAAAPSENNFRKQLETVAHAIINKNPVRVEQLTNLVVTKEVSNAQF